MSSGFPDIEESKIRLINALKKDGLLKSKLVEDAVRAIPREKFLWENAPEFVAYFDEPQPLGDTGQTISAPHMVVIMLEALELKRGLKVLEIGCGSGYNAALLGYIVSEGTKVASNEPLVVTVERDARLAEFARKKISEVGLQKTVHVIEGDGSLGYPQGYEREVYDRITVTAGAPHVPVFLKKQLNSGGVLLVPVGSSGFQMLKRLRKVAGEKTRGRDRVSFAEEELVECNFVPLVGQDAFRS